MSLLSDTQGRPNTVRALVHAMKCLGGSVSEGDLARWLLPGAFAGVEESRANTLVRQVLGCARSLGWVESDRGQHRLTNEDVPTDPAQFLDVLHQTLCTTTKVEDRRILEAYSVILSQTDATGSADWLATTNDKLADFIDSALRGGEKGGERAFNTSKLTAWREWLEAMGLVWNSIAPGQSFLPDLAPRMAREVPHLSATLGADREILPHEFLQALALRMPYLDGGAIAAEVGLRMKRPPIPDSVSLPLARALRDLEQDGVLRLITRGDSAIRGFRMPEVHPWGSGLVLGVVIAAGGDSP